MTKYAIITEFQFSPTTVALMNADIAMPSNKNAAIRKFNKWISENPGKYAELVICSEKKGDITIMKSN